MQASIQHYTSFMSLLLRINITIITCQVPVKNGNQITKICRNLDALSGRGEIDPSVGTKELIGEGKDHRHKEGHTVTD